ncbi:TolC family outer membrane protein [Rosenbergiella epipactidis]|uniref:TolC family outer membrane protein n=1 Tax=Rosenbergiella epipactidis TaxID=1544694 RepID=UPI001BD9CE21|nr:TolC family outer membrane protein [Rosenbergiella epipactidis]MBT0718459.1 TolC family outer membrane protein [Rosenbergiella epipactidis]
MKKFCLITLSHLVVRGVLGISIITSVPALADESIISAHQMIGEENLPDLYSVTPNGSVYNGQPLDMSDAVAMAVNWHPTITQAVGKLFEQSANVDVAKAKYYPQVNAGVNNGYSNTYTNKGYSPSIDISLSQMLYDFGKVSSSVRAANAAVAQQQAEVMLTIDQVAHDTASAVVQVQGYQQLVTMATQQLDSLKQIGNLIRQRNTEGASPLSDVVQTDTRIEGAQATLMQYQASLQRWQATLATYIGVQGVNRVTQDVPETLTRACAVQHPDYKLIPSVLAAWAGANQAQANVDNANAQMMPTISLEPEVTHYLNDHYSGSSELDKTQYTASIRMQMPLYQGGGLSASRDAAEQALSAANAAIKAAQLEAYQKLATSQDEATNLGQTLVIQQRQQALGEKTLGLYQDQYLQLGTRPLLDLLNVDQEIFQAKFSQAQTLAQLNSLQLDCLFSTGMMRSVFRLDNRRIQGVDIRP